MTENWFVEEVSGVGEIMPKDDFDSYKALQRRMGWENNSST